MTVFDGIKIGVGFAIGTIITRAIAQTMLNKLADDEKVQDQDQEQNDAENTEVG